MKINKIIENIIEAEGGYVNHPADRGGPTNFGITQTTLSLWRGQPVLEEDVRELTIEEARTIYLKMYYEEPQFYLLPHELEHFLVDTAIQHGPKTAVRMLQKVINSAFDITPPQKRLVEDGIVGPKTIWQAKMYVKYSPIAQLVNSRRDYYQKIVDRDASQKAFLKGWMSRLDQFTPTL